VRLDAELREEASDFRQNSSDPLEALIHKAAHEYRTGRRLNAAQTYQTAAELAQRRGESHLAQKLAAQAYQARKFSTLYSQ
jgi:hypothetical protein